MRIGFFTDSYFPGIDGVTYTIDAWKERLEERGHEVYVIYPGNPEYEPDSNEIPVRSLPNIFYSQYRIPFYLKGSEIPDLDIVHCHGPATTGIIGLRYAQKNSLKSVYTHHTPVEDYLIRGLKFKSLSKVAGKLWVMYENRFLSRFDSVTSSTSKIDRKIDLERIPVGIEMDFFQPDKRDMFEEETVIGYSGRMSKKKNIDHILKLAEKMEETRFVLVGEGPQRKKLENKSPENVEFRDFLDREKLPGFYSSIDVFLTASNCDTLGLSTLEANACGTPVAAPDLKPFNQTIKSENGSLFEFGSTESMRKSVEKCLRKDMDTRNAVEKYSIQKTIDRLEKLYEA